ncbi:STAS domain-containing protein [Cellulomonas sp. zg-ZUI222]|uniref:STAS domain-containing protein n=1 Tax=Cellulomonas wangleii TaxID=2816956 RepID=A0ABX8D4V2_9CELL|nr:MULTISPECIES: STAS domain-containing protein [Cellulomonas]MBO0898496.1 STAS domain-containing protein [Cellulomonas sp. zg-ZUI22]MBO0919360.1 STAS domain-containing protein [Cellulomonas wangleii]MBO0924494.1 STAS domain-containing protein [Cellulomonas wangleii]QVI62484.1 STAS domain-containing protein [Cellulomonas wangleii]
MTELTSAALESTPDPTDHEIRVEHRGGRAVVCLVGEIDASLRESASASMGIALMSGLPLLVDASEATFIDSSGVAFVLQLHLAASEAGVDLRLHDPHRVLRDLLDMVGLGEAVPDDV